MSTSLVSSFPELDAYSAGILLTPEEFDAIEDYDDEVRFELIRGVLVVTPIPLEAKSVPNDELGSLLREYRRNHPQGSVLDETIPEQYVRTLESRRRADRVIWAGLGRRPEPHVDPPTIIIEFVSASRRDRRRDYEEKRREYLEIGIAEYWIIDRFRRAMLVVKRQGDAIGEQQVGEGEIYRTGRLPGFELPLGQILAQADRWSDQR